MTFVFKNTENLVLFPLATSCWIWKFFTLAFIWRKTPQSLLIIAIASGHFWVHVFAAELLAPVAAMISEYFPLKSSVALADVKEKEPSFLDLHSAQGTLQQSGLGPLLSGLQIFSCSYFLRAQLDPKSTGSRSASKAILSLGHKAQAEAKLCLGLYPFLIKNF